MPDTDITELLAPETLARIDDYALLARLAVEGFISGLHRSLYHGFGVEFFQYRDYAPGDDLKYVDWKVLGKRDRFYTKVFQEETNMACNLVIDASASMAYRGSRAPCTKLKYAAMIAACLAYLASRQGDTVGLYAYADTLQTCLPAGQRNGGLRRVLTELSRLSPGGVADHDTNLTYLGENIRRRGVVVFLTDCHGIENRLDHLFRRFRFNHSDCILFQILDADEIDFPFTGTRRFVDSEIGAEIVTAPNLVRRQYLQAMDRFRETVRQTCLQIQVDHLEVNTGDNLGHLLAAYLHRREAFM